MAKTKQPTGLTISRSGYTLTASWKIGDSDYGEGQKFQYRVNGGAWRNLTSTADIPENRTAQYFYIQTQNYYPYKNVTLNSLTVRVRGRRKPYKHKKKTITPDWSDWSSTTFSIYQPALPSVTAELVETNQTNFTWSAEDSEHNPLSRVEYQTALAMDGADPSYGAIGVASANPIPVPEAGAQINDGHSYIRFLRVRAVGIGGATGWITAYHVYANPHRPTNVIATATQRAGAIDIFTQFNTWSTTWNPTDLIKTQYLITVPSDGMSIPSQASWSDGDSLLYSNGNDAVRYSVSATLAEDEIVFARAVTVHDSRNMESDPVVALIGKLKAPTLNSVTYGSDNLIDVSASHNSAVPDSFIAVEYHDMDNVDRSYIAGIIPHGQTSVQIQCPAWDDSAHVSIGVYEVVANAVSDTREDGSTVYTLFPFTNGMMKSDIVWSANVIRPTSVSVVQVRTDTARVTWKWNQSDVTGVQIAWADHDDAWESTDEPETYDVPRINSPSWNISGLESGKVWHFRLRFYIENADSTQYGAWSDMVNLNLTSAPAVPTLVLSETSVVEGTEVDATWVYITTDTTPQSYAEIREVTFAGGVAVYGDLIATTATGQKIVLNTTELGWQSGETHYMALRVQSESGMLSEWSAYVALRIVDPVTCSITNTTLESETIGDRSVVSLKEMPLTVNVSGAGNSAKTSIVIERKEPYYVERPDRTGSEGYAGEAVFVYTQTGDAEISVDLVNLIGRLDDGASYRLIATVSDDYGQKATDEIDFEVHWEHQAIMPFVAVNLNEDYNVAMVTPLAPSNALATDTCDIYRLSADKPVLIYENGTFGETYVDPYPTMGEEGGYRVVFKTKNGDYITAENQMAWKDIDLDINIKGVLIDFEGNQIHLDRNIDLSHGWKKDFTETQYLGGSVQGDWNPAVSRTGSVSAATITLLDMEQILSMRDLAVHADKCHIRTYDGSNFDCDIQVSESRSHSQGGFVATFSLSITRVDQQELDGMTLSEWLSGVQADYAYVINDVGQLIENSELPSGYTFNIADHGHLMMTEAENAYDKLTFYLKNGDLVVDYE